MDILGITEQENIGNETEQENIGDEIKQEIENLKGQNQILEGSFNNLSSKLSEYREDYLEDSEIYTLIRQIDYHIKLKKLKDEFEENRHKISKKWQKHLDKLFSDYQYQFLSIDEESAIIRELEKQEKRINPELEQSYRSYIESNIIALNSILELKYYNEFLDIFTIEYISFYEQKYWIKGLHKMHSFLIEGKSKIIPLFEEDITMVLGQTEKRMSEKIWESFDFKIWFNAIKREINSDWNNNVKTIEVERRITNNNILERKESEEWFSYNEFLEKYWLSKNALEVWIDLIRKRLKMDINKLEQDEREKVINNLTMFIAFITEVESNWKNVRNDGLWKEYYVEWYFQYKTKNKPWEREAGDFNSVEVALRRTYMYFTWEKYPPIMSFNHELTPEWLEKAYNNIEYDLLDMNAENQTIMFMADIFYRSWTGEHLKNILFSWEYDGMRKIYEDYHHTKVDINQSERIGGILGKWWEKLSSLPEETILAYLE